jgi:predicted HicB family RNase H-like nuclease
MIYGHVIDTNTSIIFEGKTVEEFYQAFKDSIDKYLILCEQLGEDPRKPFSGKLPYRTTPETHRKIFLAANKECKSINAWMDEVLTQAIKDIQ